MSQSKFLNRQSLYLRPDPARVVVRPFKPATEPRTTATDDATPAAVGFATLSPKYARDRRARQRLDRRPGVRTPFSSVAGGASIGVMSSLERITAFTSSAQR